MNELNFYLYGSYVLCACECWIFLKYDIQLNMQLIAEL